MTIITTADTYSEQLNHDLYVLKKQLSEAHKPNPEQYRRAITSANTTVICAKHESRIIGMAVLNKVFTLSSIIGDVDDVVVLDSYRGQGVARQLLDKIVEISEQQGITVLRLTSAPSRVAANRLYKNYGFKQKDTNSYRLFIK